MLNHIFVELFSEVFMLQNKLVKDMRRYIFEKLHAQNKIQHNFYVEKSKGK